MNYSEYMRRCAAEYLRELLRRHANNITEAAREAGRNRTDLYKLMQRAGVKVQRPRRYAGNDAWRSLQ